MAKEKRPKEKGAKEKKVPLRAIQDIASDLGIFEADLFKLLKPYAPTMARDHRGRVAVLISVIGKVTESPEFPAALIRMFDTERRDRVRDDGPRLRSRRETLLSRYGQLINELEGIHRRYLADANAAGPESAGAAVYLLLSRAIAMLKILNNALRAGHWYAGALLRDIDESLDLAQYFAITKDTETGARTLRRWFRENEAPTNAVCREQISKHRASLQKGVSEAQHLDLTQEHLELMQELYRKKSKWTHPTFAAIREVTEYEAGSQRIAAIDYGPCRHERKLFELTDFFKSSIWSTYQTLFLCFHYTLNLREDDIRLLYDYDRMFGKWTERARAGLED